MSIKKIKSRIAINKKLDFLIYPPVQIISSLLISFVFITGWNFLFVNFHPDSHWRTLTLIYAVIAISISSFITSILVKYPSMYLYFTTIINNLISFSTITIILIFGRLPYHRPDLLIYFLISTMVLFSTAWVYERRRTYVFLHLPLGKRIDFRSYPNVRIFRFKYDRNSIIKSSLLRKIDGIIVDCSMDIPRHWQVFISNACIKGAKLYDRSEIIEQVDGYVPYENFVHIVGHWNLSLELYGYVKRLLDITASVFLVPFFVPIILVASFFIKVDSGGPVFFSQKRLGRYGKEFSIYKLRTMFHSENAVPVENAKHKDSRITKVGKVLRKYRIDELPQIFNVIKGDMSWIGPRPETVELSKKYTNEIPLYLYRNVVRPGISGWAAINQGYVGSVSETIHKLNYDLFYIKNLSFELDLLIAIRTIYVIASGFGSR